MERTRILCLILTLVAVIFVAASLVLPWWSLRLSTEASMITESIYGADYGLFKTVTGTSCPLNVSVSDALNASATVDMTNLTLPDKPPDSFMYMDVTLGLTVAGLVFTIPIIMIVLIPSMTKYSKYVVTMGYVSMALLLVSTVYFATQLPQSLSNLSSLSPVDIPSDWTPIQPKDIASAWGSKVASLTSPVSKLLEKGNFWVWQPSTGWFLTFSASFLMIAASSLVHLVFEKEKKTAKPMSTVLNVDKRITASDS